MGSDWAKQKEKILLNDFQIRSLFKSVNDVQILAMIPIYGSMGDFRYGVFFKYSGFVFLDTVHYHNNNHLEPNENRFEDFEKTLKKEIGKKKDKLNKSLFDKECISRYSKKDLHNVLYEQINTDMFRFLELKKFMFRNGGSFTRDKFSSFFDKMLLNGYSSLDTYLKILEFHHISQNDIMNFIDNYNKEK